MGWFSPLLGRVFPGNAVCPSPAAPLCWVFCLPPREPVGPAEFCAQGLCRGFSEPVLLCVVACWQPGCWSGCVADLRLGLGLAVNPSFGSVRGGSQPLIRLCTHPGAFCLCTQAVGLLIRSRAHPGFQVWAPGHWLGYAPTGSLWVWRPVIRARAHPEFQLWAPSPLI